MKVQMISEDIVMLFQVADGKSDALMNALEMSWFRLVLLTMADTKEVACTDWCRTVSELRGEFARYTDMVQRIEQLGSDLNTVWAQVRSELLSLEVPTGIGELHGIIRVYGTTCKHDDAEVVRDAAGNYVMEIHGAELVVDSLESFLHHWADGYPVEDAEEAQRVILYLQQCLDDGMSIQ